MHKIEKDTDLYRMLECILSQFCKNTSSSSLAFLARRRCSSCETEASVRNINVDTVFSFVVTLH